MQKFVFFMLTIDLQPYAKKGNGMTKSCLPKKALEELVDAYFKNAGMTEAEKRAFKKKPYAERGIRSSTIP